MEAYCIEANKWKNNNKWEALSMGVNNGKWCSPSDLKKKTMKLQVDPFWIAPGKVYIDFQFPLFHSPYQTSLLRRYIYRGCTLLLTQLPITSKRQMKSKWADYKKSLEGLAIDYMIVPRVPIHYLDDEMVRFFSRLKVPFILFEVSTEAELYKKRWQWISQAQNPFCTPVVPVFLQDNLHSLWDKFVRTYEIISLPSPLDELPLGIDNLKATGIYPYKGEVIPSGDADYNLFRVEKEEIEAPDQMFYHKAIPYVTVLRGKIIRAHVEMNDERGYGNYREVSIPNHFSYR